MAQANMIIICMVRRAEISREVFCRHLLLDCAHQSELTQENSSPEKASQF
jgi:hypothetical protein